MRQKNRSRADTQVFQALDGGRALILNSCVTEGCRQPGNPMSPEVPWKWIVRVAESEGGWEAEGSSARDMLCLEPG